MLFYQLQQLAVRHTMKEMLELDASNLECLVISRDVYDKSRIGRDEILLDGMMYDVKRVEKCGDEVHVYCLADAKEKEILAGIKVAAEKNSRDKSLPNLLIQLLNLSYVAQHPEIHFLPTVNQINLLITSTVILPMAKDDVPSPPPKLV